MATKLLKTLTIVDPIIKANFSSVPCHQLNLTAFVPRHDLCTEKDKNTLQHFVQKSSKLFVITGAGISTESGIPDYRSENVGLYATSKKRPVNYQDFLLKPSARQSYWARTFAGWHRFASSEPNETHKTLAKWEKKFKIGHLVTQNVDRLHKKAGSVNVTELHGTLFEVQCIKCNFRLDRYTFQQQLCDLNPRMLQNSQDVRPDGDVELAMDIVSNFIVPACPLCGGILKPFVVFFGDTVPKSRVDEVTSHLKQCDALLALGTSLQVYSAYRFILQAVELKMPMAAVNIGPTRADHLFEHKISCRCGEILPQIKLF